MFHLSMPAFPAWAGRMRRRSMPRLHRLLACVALLALAAGGASAHGKHHKGGHPAGQSAAVYDIGHFKIGGEFALINQDGDLTRLSQFHGKVVLLAFGYTSCPDVCPMTVAEMARVRKDLAAQASAFQGVFITVDPRRDTPQVLKKFLAAFDPTFVGLTGRESAVHSVARLYQARYITRKVDAAAGYAVDHTSLVYLIDRRGRVRYVFPYDAGAEVMAEAARTLLHASS